MSDELRRLKESLAENEAKRSELMREARHIEAEILRLETDASPWRVGMVLERSYKVRPWDEDRRTERAVVTGTELAYDGARPKLRRILKDGSLGKQHPYYYEAWKPTGETVDLEES